MKRQFSTLLMITGVVALSPSLSSASPRRGPGATLGLGPTGGTISGVGLKLYISDRYSTELFLGIPSIGQDDLHAELGASWHSQQVYRAPMASVRLGLYTAGFAARAKTTLGNEHKFGISLAPMMVIEISMMPIQFFLLAPANQTLSPHSDLDPTFGVRGGVYYFF